MKKQGFTLIELMVVIVIMGILAAVAVPKLFGMIAKSKASEVGPAAGTYVKLQDAYVAEVGTHVGRWAQIGYVMNNSSNLATNVATLNECKNGSLWKLETSQNGSQGGLVLYTATDPCNTLTPNFERLNTKSGS